MSCPNRVPSSPREITKTPGICYRDEVVGQGRTGKMFARTSRRARIVAVAKAWHQAAAGRDDGESGCVTFRQDPREHFGGNPVGCAAELKTIEG